MLTNKPKQITDRKKINFLHVYSEKEREIKNLRARKKEAKILIQHKLQTSTVHIEFDCKIHHTVQLTQVATVQINFYSVLFKSEDCLQ